MSEKPNSSNDSAGVNRRNFLRAWGVAGALAASGLTVPTVLAEEAQEINEIWTQVLASLPDNWGRWGDNDQIGTINYLDTEQIQRGLEAATAGDGDVLEVFPLQLPYTGDVILPDSPSGDPVFPTRQVARRDNVVDAQTYQEGAAEPLKGGMKFADDAFITRIFLQGSTQYDALSHVWYDHPTEDGGREPLLYNGFPAETTADVREFDKAVPGLRPKNPQENPFSTDLQLEEITQTRGSAKCDIEHVAEHGSVGRGILLDVGRHMDSKHPTRLDPGQCVTLQDLQETAQSQGVEIQQRDILLIRVGSTARARDPEEFTWLGDPQEPLKEAGLCFSQDLVQWLHDMEIPVIGADNLAVEKLTNAQIDIQEDLNEDIRGQIDFGGRDTLEIVNPLHPAMITNLGMTVCEILWLEELAATCAEDGVYEFMYSGSPLKIIRGAGAPINPTVVKSTTEEALDAARQTPTETTTTTPSETTTEETTTTTTEETTTTPTTTTTTGENVTEVTETTTAEQIVSGEDIAQHAQQSNFDVLATVGGLGSATAYLGVKMQDEGGDE